MHDRINEALQIEIARNHHDHCHNVNVKIVECMQTLHILSDKHAEVLLRYKRQHPAADFPALHKELFSQEGIDCV